ncbi:17760_t:CDS:1, partial [Entrophospora sp. SA101]
KSSVLNHLEKCGYFKEKWNEEKTNEILYDTGETESSDDDKQRKKTAF